MIQYYLDNPVVEYIKKYPRYENLSKQEHIRLYSELRNAILQGKDKRLFDLSLEGNDPIPNGVSSLLLWVLGITDEYPSGPQKVKSVGSYADIDVDFSQERRKEVPRYLSELYGENRVTNIATFGMLKAKASVKSAARALGYPVDMGTAVSKYIPNVADITLESAINENEALQKILSGSEGVDLKKILDVALKLEGLPNTVSSHASAYVISEDSLVSYMPLMVSKKEGGGILSQFDMKDVESIGLLKFDILGLKTLDVIKGTVDLIKERRNINVDIESIDVNDSAIYDLLSNGHNTGVFQFESSTAVSFVKQIKPQNINETSDLTSLLRPGPLSMGMMDQYANAKFAGEKHKYGLTDENLIHKIWEICHSSYGLIVYQEQAIKCFTEIANFNEIEGDNARRAMGKKKPEEMAALEVDFIAGGLKNGYDANDLKELFKQIELFSGYAFNKSHSICYSYITCQTAWLSAYYPLEFYATLLTIDAGNTNDVRRYIKAFKDRGFKIEAPSLNESEVSFKISDSNQSIIFGLSGIKGVGNAVSNKILKKRGKKGYKGFGDFIIKNFDLVNKKIIEQYAKAGAFRCFGFNKETILHNVEKILNFLGTIKEVQPYYSIFDITSLDLAQYIDRCILSHNNLPDNPIYEVETLGLYITKHPMEDYIINDKVGFSVRQINEDLAMEDGTRVITAGAITGIEIRKTKAKTNMATFDLTTEDSSIGCICFPAVYAKILDSLEEGRIVAIRGMIREETAQTSSDDDSMVKTTRIIGVNDVMVDLDKSKALSRIERFNKNNTDTIKWFNHIDDINVDKGESFGIRVNNKLSYILKRS